MFNKWKAPEKISYLTACNAPTVEHIIQPLKFTPSAPIARLRCLVNYDLNAARQHVDRDEIRRRLKGMWRWHELLPVCEPQNMVTLGEGMLPLLHLPRWEIARFDPSFC